MAVKLEGIAEEKTVVHFCEECGALFSPNDVNEGCYLDAPYYYREVRVVFSSLAGWA